MPRPVVASQILGNLFLDRTSLFYVKETEKQIDGVCGSERKIAFGDVAPLPCGGEKTGPKMDWIVDKKTFDGRR
jgi:hypothetical protein